jgi:hypothetical protein
MKTDPLETIIKDLMRIQVEQGAKHEALLRVFVESSSDPLQQASWLKAYESYCAALRERLLLDLGQRFPRLAADLDDHEAT